ncbi:hypothetical protein [Azohydromonas sediminis]|uniref:hypothetical protein n=1 Tax=Azohydromonas sediminis TaxID=2259674 RepID=UPI000E64AD1E|nr:hypothetical protein [Azohydromonas sediminis]
MANKGFTRGQTQVLFRHLPEAVFEHDDYGLCKVTQVALGDADVNRDALFDAISDALAMWPADFSTKYPDTRDASRRSYYAVGSPREVRFVPYPQVFRCRACSRTGKFTDLLKRGASASGRCTCGGYLNQMRYVQAHNCGRLEEVFVPQQNCPSCGSSKDLAFYDPGRVKQARWYCAKCKADIQALRMTPCKCAYNKSLPPGPRAEKYLRVVPTGDPSLYIPHTVAFVNFPEDDQGKLKSAPDALQLMLARTWGLLKESVSETIRERSSMGKPEDADRMAETIEALRKFDPTNKLVLEYDAKKKAPKGQAEIDRVNDLLKSCKVTTVGAPRRWLVEHTTLLDRTDISTIEDVAAMLRRTGDEAGARDIEEGRDKASALLGISDIRIVNDFPLALCAYGYTRTSREPARTVITPFPVDDRGRIPVYAIAAETEALWFQLDPLKVYSWLFKNGIVGSAPPASREEAWARLYAEIPGLRSSPHEPMYDQLEAVAVRTLLHTMSHLFLRRIEWSGFAPSSVGEYLIPGSLSFILYANRHAETKIGGLTTLFEQRLNTWLWDAVQSGRECVYDPICEDDGGSCAGCTHREHNCVSFNRELSRAAVYGGPTPQYSAFQGAKLAHGYWQDAWKAAPVE